MVLEQHGIGIRLEQLDGHEGGLCRIQGRPVVFLDRSALSSDTARICADAVLSIVDDIDSIYLRPQTRRFIEERKKASAE